MGTQAHNRARLKTVRSKANFGKRKQVNVRPTQWDVGEFIAIDGEGFSDGREFALEVGANKTRYTGRGHYYAYLSASDGSELYAPTGRLGLFQCLEFLCACIENNPRGILVAFGATYDVCHMVCHDLGPDEIAKLLGKVGKGRLLIEGGGFVYLLEYRPRKVFTISRWESGARRWTTTKSGKRVSTPHLTVRLWDVWGFFQDSFVGVLKKWVPGDPDFEFVQRMKGERNQFERSEIAEIKRYNAAELRLLVKVMNRVRDAINDLGLKITRWDGAGAVAAAMLTKHDVKAHKGELPPDVFEAARRAYSGGHIEACKVGYHRGAVHHYDVNSAYPSIFVNLPSVAEGEWISGTGKPPPGYTLVQVEWQFPEGLPFYPLFYRCEDGAILYPYRGSGWYWFPEFAAARAYHAKCAGGVGDLGSFFKVKAWYHFRTREDKRPFGWVGDYYLSRQNYIDAARRGGFTSGPEKIIKLGLNSLYGKTVQQVGAREDGEGNLRLPPFFQLDWGGYVTAGCRAQLMQAAIQKPHAIIAFATDGLFSTEPLDLDCPDEKTLGAWEYQIHDGITVVMPGVYWLHDGEETKHYSRGFDKREMSDPEFVREAWRKKQDAVPVQLTRLIGLGSAITSKDYWKMRGTFANSTRSLCLDGDNSKRYPINLYRDRPHLGLVDTVPRDHFMSNLFDIPESAPYPIAWLDGGFQSDDLEGEMADEWEAMDAELA